jgi:AmmeMemoRadiSam system protein B
MLRLPAVAGQFYPANPRELSSLVRQCLRQESPVPKEHVKGCLVPHAGYIYSGNVAGAVFARIEMPQKVIVLGVRHFPRGESVAILSDGAWRTPLGDLPVDSQLAQACKEQCSILKEDAIAHAQEHSLEVQLPFLQVLQPATQFVPIALGTIKFEELQQIGEGVARVIASSREEILLLTSSDLNHYEDDMTTRRKDALAVAQLEAMDPHGLYDICRKESISMCGLGPAVASLVALRALGTTRSETVMHATSAAISHDYRRVVGYAGLIFN